MHLQQLLKPQIPIIVVKEMNDRDIDNLLKSYSVIDIALSDFLAQKLSFDEYIQLCELHEMNVDSYMATIEQNLEQTKLI